MKIRYISLIAIILSITSFGLAQKKAAPLAPDAVVRNLYAAQKGSSGPFFQKKSRALVDKFFTKELADLIWKDSIEATDGVGAIDFDPLYDAQDVRITQFKIGKPEYGEGNSEIADVPVTFKNMGKGETVLYRLERNSRSKMWKISEISYPQREESNTLTKILSYDASTDSQATPDIRRVDFKNFDYGALCAGEHKFLALEGNLVLKKGHQQEKGDDLNYLNLGSVKYVDFDGDGKEEAFVVVNGQSAGSSNSYIAAYVFAYQNNQPKAVWTKCEENSTAVLKDTTIIFTRPDWLDSDAHCCFSFVATDTYGWKDAQIALIATKRKKTGGK